MPRISFHKEKVFDVEDLDKTLLEHSLENGITHCHACGGNARCSTCRVLVLEGAENLPPRNEAEALLAKQKGFDDNIRLACQTRIRGPVSLRRLVIDSEDMEVAVAGMERSVGIERNLAVLFSDVRNFTPFSEGFLPYDVVHILNRYFRKVGEEILRHDGYIDKYMGDGIMALFGLEKSDPKEICADAMLAGLAMLEALTDFNDYMQRQFETSLKIGVGIHFGQAIVGEMGHPKKMQFSAIGDTVNTASRIESATKEHHAGLLISEAVYAHVKDFAHVGKSVEASLKGKSGQHRLYEITGVDAGFCKQRRLRNLGHELRKELLQTIARTDAPLILRLAFHDAGTYDPETKRGGANGSVRFPEEMQTADNQPLKPALATLEKVKAKFPEISWADLIALGGAVAVEKCGGPAITVDMGRTDAAGPDACRALPSEHLDAAGVMSWFAGAGFSVRETVALCGGHTLGHGHNKPFTNDLFNFTNSYYKRLLYDAQRTDLVLLDSDRALTTVPQLRVHVEEFARDQDAFFKAFAEAYRKLTRLGTGLGVI